MRTDPTELLAAWTRTREAGIDLFAPNAKERMGGLAGLGEFGGEAAAHDVSLLSALQAMTLASNEARTGTARIELVVSLPTRIRGLLRTSEVARSLVQVARKEVLVIGYELRDGELRRLLEMRGAEGIAVTVVGNRAGGGARNMLRDWPAHNRPLAALEDVEPLLGDRHIMHGKVIVADRSVALVGSANFTFSGLHGNFEFGVKVEGGIAGEIATLVERLERQGWLRRITLG